MQKRLLEVASILQPAKVACAFWIYRISYIRSRPRLEAEVFFDVGEIQAALYY